MIERVCAYLAREPMRGRLMAILKMLGYRDEQWIRVAMAAETRQLIEAIDDDSHQVLEISGKVWEGYFPEERYQQLHYPDIDICKETTDTAFDLIVLEQVLEHVLQPRHALSNIAASLNPGGHVLVTTPFMVRFHGFPLDCSRWTEIGMRQLLIDAGFEDENIHTGSWGNKSCMLSNLHVWQRYNPYIHSLKNDPRYPLMVWALARKATAEPDQPAEEPVADFYEYQESTPEQGQAVA